MEAAKRPGASSGQTAASTAASGQSAPAADLSRALRDVNLLQVTYAQVAVSSAIRNPRDFPEFLIDNHLDTAWNSQTGDLIGGWMAFRLPAEATIHRIELTAGYDRVKDKTDLFSANHRITRVEVLRGKESLGLFNLDPNVRGLQTLAVSGPGGDYQLIVRSTKPGTRKDWRELAVSELRVIGDPGKARRPPDQPLGVAIGSLDNSPSNDFGLPVREADVDDQAFASVTELCAARVIKEKASAPENRARQKELGVTHFGEPSCFVEKPSLPLPSSPLYRELASVKVSDGDGVVTWTQLVVHLRRGYVALPVFLNVDDPTDPGCPSLFRPSAMTPVRIENGHLIVTLISMQWDGARSDDKHYYTLESHGAVWCKEAGGHLKCHDYLPNMTQSLGDFAIGGDGTLRPQGKGL